MAPTTEGLVATVGKIVVEPNAGNVIAGTAQMSLDVRHAHDALRLAAVEELAGDGQRDRGAPRTGCAGRLARWISRRCRWTSGSLRFLAESIEAAGFPLKQMPSGAGHDAMVMAGRVPTAMLFLRSPGGISHHPAETVREEDVEAALQVGRKFLERLAAEVG